MERHTAPSSVFVAGRGRGVRPRPGATAAAGAMEKSPPPWSYRSSVHRWLLLPVLHAVMSMVPNQFIAVRHRRPRPRVVRHHRPPAGRVQRRPGVLRRPHRGPRGHRLPLDHHRPHRRRRQPRRRADLRRGGVWSVRGGRRSRPRRSAATASTRTATASTTRAARDATPAGAAAERLIGLDVHAAWTLHATAEGVGVTASRQK
jgi:hypothetical protein